MKFSIHTACSPFMCMPVGLQYACASQVALLSGPHAVYVNQLLPYLTSD